VEVDDVTRDDAMDFAADEDDVPMPCAGMRMSAAARADDSDIAYAADGVIAYAADVVIAYAADGVLRYERMASLHMRRWRVAV
jgi:hypothetical protein